MKHEFKITQLPNNNFEIKKSIWTGKAVLLMDNIELKKSKIKGKPFEVPKADGTIILAYAKHSYPEFAPEVKINGEIIYSLEKLKTYEYILGGLPIILIFAGGLFGGVVGLLASLKNFSIIREEKNNSIKYAKVFGITIATYLSYLLLVTLLAAITKS